MEQVIVLLTGALAIWLTQQPNESLKKWAGVIGLLGQPFWLIITFQAGQWGMFALSIFYTYSFLLGIYYNWIKKG